MPWPFSKKDPNAPPRSAYFGSSTPLLSYWIYFKERPVAEEAVVRLQALDLTADLQKAASGKKPWLVLAYRPVPDGPESVERESASVKAVAAALAGEYDGWEAGPLLDEQMADRIQDWFSQGIGQP